MRRRHGFSLIELLIAMSIIMIIAAIAIPRLLRTRMAAAEASVANTMKEIRTSNSIYYSRFNVGYAGNLEHLGPTSGSCATSSSACADLVDAVLAGVVPSTPTPVRGGYRFTYYAASHRFC